MKRIIFLSIMVFSAYLSLAHEGEDHGTAKAAVTTGTKYFSSEAVSDKYELLVKYGELQGGAKSVFQLFLSEAQTNRAIDSATISLKLVGRPGVNFSIARVDTGIYQISGVFPANEIYDLQVNVNSRMGPDFLQVPKIEIGKKLEVVVPEVDHWYDNPVLWAVVGIFLGLLVMYFLMRRKNKRTVAVMLFITMMIPTAVMNPTIAHEGEDHGAGGAKTGGISSSILVEKESQFLFDILTYKTGPGSFYQSTELLGTVTASPQGLAVIQTPQTGKIVALRVTPGQQVYKGQTLAIIEQQIEAGTQIDLIAERNTLNAEVKAAKAQYDRLLSIADIAAKKDVSEARARYETAVQNLRLFNANIGNNMGSTKMIRLNAPINGVVGTFNYAIGAVVSSGQTLFEITNLDRIYIETQVFASSPGDASKGRFEAFSANDTIAYALRLISSAQSVSQENQAQRVVFEVIRPNGNFRIGENVRVLQYGANRIAQLVVPTVAIVDISGKPAVFIKDKAEQFSVSFIQKGESNPLYTAIAKGVEAGEKVVTGNVYQMKMIYLGQ